LELRDAEVVEGWLVWAGAIELLLQAFRLWGIICWIIQLYWNRLAERYCFCKWRSHASKTSMPLAAERERVFAHECVSVRQHDCAHLFFDHTARPVEMNMG
jgi:hypothetical protein